MKQLDKKFWENLYENQQTGWDIGYVSPPIKNYFDQLSSKDQEVLIPGCGNAYEAAYLFQAGFLKVSVLDWSESALGNFQKRVIDFPEAQLIQSDFFQHNGQYDLIIEQTFFCAILPSLRKQYVEKVHELLKPGGKLVGLLFNIPLFEERPPFGGEEESYRALFEPYFKIKIMETCYNSIPSRSGNELFVVLEK